MAMNSCDTREEWNTRLFERKSLSFSHFGFEAARLTYVKLQKREVT